VTGERAGRGVLVTGASGGIGGAIAAVFAEAGDRVALHYGHNREAAEARRAALAGRGHVCLEADLRDPAATRELVGAAARALGGLDVVVNNAGLYRPHPIDETSYEAWQEAWAETLAVNLVAPANIAWCAMQYMPAGGRIVNVSSRGAFRGEPRQPAYGASKAGLNAFGQSLARALGARGIAVATVAPGYVETSMAEEDLSGPGGDERRAQSPLGRVARPEEVAAAVYYLASPAAEFATGAILDLNGASYLRT